MNYFVPFLIAVFVNVVTGFYFYHRGKKDSDKGEKRLLSEIGKMLHDRGLKVTLVEEKPVDLGSVKPLNIAEKKLIDEFTKDFKEKMRAEKSYAELLTKLSLKMLFEPPHGLRRP